MNVRRIMPNITTYKVDECSQFYTSIMDLELVMDMDLILMFASKSNETAQLSVIKGDELQTTEGISITFEVEDVDAMYHKVDQHGIKITYPLTNEDYGVRRFQIKDPNGMTLNIMSHIK